MLLDHTPVTMSFFALLIPWILFAWNNKEHGPRALWTTTDFRIQRDRPTILTWKHAKTEFWDNVYVSITLFDSTTGEQVLQVFSE